MAKIGHFQASKAGVKKSIESTPASKSYPHPWTIIFNWSGSI